MVQVSARMYNKNIGKESAVTFCLFNFSATSEERKKFTADNILARLLQHSHFRWQGAPWMAKKTSIKT